MSPEITPQAMRSSYQSEQGASSTQLSKSAFCVPLSQALKSQSNSRGRSVHPLVDQDCPVGPVAPFKINRVHNQFSTLFEPHKKVSLSSDKIDTEGVLASNRKCQNFLRSDNGDGPGSYGKEHPDLSNTSFDIQLSQVLESQMFKDYNRPSSMQNPLKSLPSKSPTQYIEIPPAPDNRCYDQRSSVLRADKFQNIKPQYVENEPCKKMGSIAGVQSVKPCYVADEPFKTTDSPDVAGIHLRSVTEIQIYQDIFRFPYFNILQSLVFDEVFYTDKSIVASAPTGSGKTVIFELALIRLLTKLENSGHRGKIVYMAPMKALCTERYQDWTSKFSCHGLSCLEITGDSELDDFGDLLQTDLICTTPEKWDSMSRRWRDNKSLFHQIQLFLIDEVHILNDSSRGATVEAVVSRMKTLQTAHPSAAGIHIRFVAVSATMPNFNDIAEWLGTYCKPAAAFNLGEKFRPVKLDRIVLAYPFKEGTSDFRFDMNLSYRLRAIIETYSHGKPTLVFCSSRKSVVLTAETLAKSLRVRTFLNHFRADILQQAANSVHEHKLSELLQLGIGMHHAGMDMRDRHTVEELFRTSQLPALISTSTLAMGVNLPAHLVIIKSTHFYNMGVVQEYSDMQILQMIGRAGRPQFDTSATAVIMTKAGLKSRYESLVNGTQLIESSLHKNLIEHLNAEIVLQTISEMTLVVEWIRHTFLYVRVMKNPKYYGLLSNLSRSEVEKQLTELCQKSLNQLASLNLVSINEETSSIFPTSTGRLMARYCVAYETMKQFHNIRDDQGSIADMLTVMSQCTEFEDIQLRTSEKKMLNSFNRDKNRETIRFQMPGKIKTRQMKVNCLIQAQLSCLPVQDFSLSQDMAKIFRVGQRVAKCLMEFMYQRSSYSVLLHAILIYKAFKCKLWFDSRYVARQLDGIGPTMSLALANAGLTSIQKLEEVSPREIELIVNRHAPFGNQIKEAVSALPKYELAVEQMKCYKPNKAVLILSVDLLNRSILEAKPSSHNNHQSLLIVGDTEDNLIFKWRISDAAILRGGVLTQTLEVKRSTKGTKVNISLLSHDWVGLDIHMDYEPVYSEGWFEAVKMPQNQKAQTPASKLSQAVQLAKMRTPLNKQVSSITPVYKAVGKCNHKCLEKTMCGHKCCKSSSNKRISPTAAETQHAKLPRRETSVLKENKGIKEMFDIVEQHSSVRNKPRISMTRGPGLKAITLEKPTLPVSPEPVSRSCIMGIEEGKKVCDVDDLTDKPSGGDDHLHPSISRIYTQDPRRLTPKQQAVSCNLDFSVNGWADLDAFHRSRQELFVNGRPEHLQEQLLYEDELPNLSGSPEMEVTAVDEGVEENVDNLVWSTTTSSDEELCQIVGTNIMPAADDEEWLHTACDSSILNDKRMPCDPFDNVYEAHDDEELVNETEELDSELETESKLTTFRRSGNCGMPTYSSPAVISVNDSDSILSVSSTDNQFGLLSPCPRFPVLYAGKLSQSVTPILMANKDLSAIVTCKENQALEPFKSGQLNDSSFTDKTSHNNDDLSSSQLYHRYGHVQAWKKDASNSAKNCRPGLPSNHKFV